jgi:hypothetical protein
MNNHILDHYLRRHITVWRNSEYVKSIPMQACKIYSHNYTKSHNDTLYVSSGIVYRKSTIDKTSYLYTTTI